MDNLDISVEEEESSASEEEEIPENGDLDDLEIIEKNISSNFAEPDKK